MKVVQNAACKSSETQNLCSIKELDFLKSLSYFVCSDKGMKYMVGKNWRDLFDMVIVQADKPSFFTDKRKYVSLIYFVA